MDYSELNIYNKNKFILRSETRQRKFPFIKFDGSNYEEVKAFLSLYAPNIIIEPQALKIGELYSISGKDYSLLRIPYDELRFVIASNPYLVSEEGVISLALDSEQAEEYLKENRHHKLFAFENPLATYKFIPEHSAFMMYDYSHPLGLAFNDLHKEYEWYICGDDGANRKWYGQKIEINTVNHTIALRPDFGGLVYRIVHIITAINKNLAIQGRPAMFVYSWDIEEWKKILKKKCLNEEHFRAFVDTLYSIVFNRNRGDRTIPIEDIDDTPFAKIIDGLHQYVHGRESKKAPVTQIFSNYLNHNQGPHETYDYTKLKEGILIDFYDYLIKILESVKNDLTIIGTICEDENGCLYCGKALLSQAFYMYRGCKCVVTSLIKNPDENTVGKYPYYSDRLNSVTLTRTGIISQDEEGTFYVDKYILKGAVADQLGKEVQLERIHPFDKPRGQYLGDVIEYVLANKVHTVILRPISKMPGRENPKDMGNNSTNWAYRLSDDLFDGRVDTSHVYISGLKNDLKSTEAFSPLFNYILSLGGINSDEEAGALLRAFTGHPVENANEKASWMADYHILYYLVKYMFTPKSKFVIMSECIDIHYPSDDERQKAEKSPSSYAERISGDDASSIIETLYRLSDVFPNPPLNYTK